MAVIRRQNVVDLLQRALGVGRNGGRKLMGGRKLTARKASFLVEVALVGILGVLLGLIFLSFFAPLSLPENEIVTAAPTAQQNGVLDVKSPFPATTLAAAPLERAPAVAETTLDLTLTGVWANPDGGSATIRLPDGAEKRFAVGDTIVQGVTLAAVYPDQVTLSRGGVREALRFESKTTPVEQRTAINALNEQSLSVPSAAVGRIASVLRFAPALKSDGRFVIEIYAARDRRTFAALGLQDGDRLVSINGAPAPINPAALGNLVSEMQQSDAATVIVERGGEEIPIVISMDQLGNE